MDDLLAEFVAETREMLEASAGEIVAWEANPADSTRLDTIFRFVHTVKGNCGFFDFPRLERLSHAAEDALAGVRAGRRTPDAALVDAVLAITDRISQMIDIIEAGGDLGETGDEALIAALDVGGGAPRDAKEATPTADDRYVVTPAEPHTAKDLRSIRLPVELLDRMMSGVSDMVLARNDLARRLREAGTEPTIDGPFERLTSILGDVREAVTRMRMQRIETLFGAFPRLVRDLSAELGKQVLIDLEGGDVELDREMVEMIRDPMTHIIRNAIDHGIERPVDRLKAGKREIGLLSIAARQSGNKIWILVSDDGRGLDEQRIAEQAISTGIITASERKAMSRDEILRLIFHPGLSTAEQVSAISGRGVGMDVVHANLEKVGGSIDVSSIAGEGTSFHLQLPLTLSIVAGLTVGVGDQRFAIPRSNVEEIVRENTSAAEYVMVGDTGFVTFRGNRVTCLDLAAVLGIKTSRETASAQRDDRIMVIVQLTGGAVFALLIDAIHDHGDLVVKPLAPAVAASGLFAGTTLLEDGQPILMLDMPAIALANGLADRTKSRRPEIGTDRQAAARKIERAMLFTGLDGKRRAIRLELVQRIETISPDAVEREHGRAQAVVDGAILQLIGADERPLPNRLRMLRLTDGDSDLLYAVAEIEDAIVLEEDLVPAPDDPLIEGTTLVHAKPVTLVDGFALFARHGSGIRQDTGLRCRLPDTEWARTFLAPLVESVGYHAVIEGDEDADIVIALGSELPEAGSQNVILLHEDRESGSAPAGSIYRYDREALLDALRMAGEGAAA